MLPHPGFQPGSQPVPDGLRCPRRKSTSLALASEAPPPTTHCCISQCALYSSQTTSSVFSEHSGASPASMPLPRPSSPGPAGPPCPPFFFVWQGSALLYGPAEGSSLCSLPRRSGPAGALRALNTMCYCPLKNSSLNTWPDTQTPNIS